MHSRDCSLHAGHKEKISKTEEIISSYYLLQHLKNRSGLHSDTMKRLSGFAESSNAGPDCGVVFIDGVVVVVCVCVGEYA